MYSLTIAFGETPAMWRLLFKTKEAAHNACAGLVAIPSINIADDFGQQCSLLSDRILGWMLEDLDQSKQAGAEMMLHNARTQAAAQTQARTEPALRSGAQGPSVFVPNGSGRMS
jgi:hypothetical protein